jgi:hypothetical protein
MYQMLKAQTAVLWGRLEHGTTCVQYRIPPKERMPCMPPVFFVPLSVLCFFRLSLRNPGPFGAAFLKNGKCPAFFAQKGATLETSDLPTGQQAV